MGEPVADHALQLGCVRQLGLSDLREVGDRAGDRLAVLVVDGVRGLDRALDHLGGRVDRADLDAVHDAAAVHRQRRDEVEQPQLAARTLAEADERRAARRGANGPLARRGEHAQLGHDVLAGDADPQVHAADRRGRLRHLRERSQLLGVAQERLAVQAAVGAGHLTEDERLFLGDKLDLRLEVAEPGVRPLRVLERGRLGDLAAGGRLRGRVRLTRAVHVGSRGGAPGAEVVQAAPDVGEPVALRGGDGHSGLLQSRGRGGAHAAAASILGSRPRLYGWPAPA